MIYNLGKYFRGKRVEGQWVFGGVERDSHKCFLEPVEDRTAETLIQLIKDWILFLNKEEIFKNHFFNFNLVALLTNLAGLASGHKFTR